jgi:hypothetical protein
VKFAHATGIARDKRFFHWFLEFPEIFQNVGFEQGRSGGFDCILGNPPFLGGMKISTMFKYQYLTWLFSAYEPAKGTADLVSYFFRRIFQIIKENGFQSLISTNTISQGNTRESGLEYIVNNNGQINFAIRTMKWPGIATVEVSLITIHKGSWNKSISLNGKIVTSISSFLDDQNISIDPYQLNVNQSKSFIGSYILGKGFIYENDEAMKIIEENCEYKSIIFPFFNGDDLNNSFDTRPSRFVINFFDWEIEKAKKFPICFERICSLVKPEREKLNRTNRKEKWWQYAEKAPNLYKAIENKDQCFAFALTGKILSFSIVKTQAVFSHATGIIANDSFTLFPFLQCSFHEVWSWKYCSSMGISLRYTPSTAFETFPFPQNLSKEQEAKLEQIGEQFHEHRRQLMLAMQLGLTKTYNAFHAKEVQLGITTAALQTLDKKAIEKQYGKEVWNLWNHLQKIPNTCTIEEAIAGIVKLRQLHVEMDEAVLEAYGWGFDSAQPPTGDFGSAQSPDSSVVERSRNHHIELRHDFYEVDYLPENDRIRYTIHPDARKEVLKRLLLLNHERYEEELKQGLHKKEDAEKFYKEKGVEIPEEVKKHYLKKYEKPKAKPKNLEEPKGGYKQGNLGI